MILRAAWVAPVVGPPIRDGFVRIESGRIVAVGPASALPADDAREAIQFDDAILTPGLINPHTHLELTGYAGQLRPGPLWDWLLGLVKLRRRPDQVEFEAAAVRDGAWQSLRAGVTCVGDISRRNVSWKALQDVPIRKVCFVELLSLADHPPRDPAELRAATAEVVEDDLLRIGVSPHAPYTVPLEQVHEAVLLAAELGRPWTMHLAETREEVAFLAGDDAALPAFLVELLRQCGVRPTRQSPIQLLQSVALGTPGLLAHMNYLGEDESLAALAAAGHTVAYCPRAHAFFGHENHPLPRLKAAGVLVVFGTDSAASNSSLAILPELRHVQDHYPGLFSATELLERATRGAARALQLGHVVGALEPGLAADLTVFPLDAANAGDPIAALIDAAPAARAVWVAGERVV